MDPTDGVVCGMTQVESGAHRAGDTEREGRSGGHGEVGRTAGTEAPEERGKFRGGPRGGRPAEHEPAQDLQR